MINPKQIYNQQQAAGENQLNLCCSLYDAAIFRLEQAQTTVDSSAAWLVSQAQFAVYGLAAQVDPQGGELAHNLLRLYDFVLDCLGQLEAKRLAAALKVLKTLREGWQGLRQASEALIPQPLRLTA